MGKKILIISVIMISLVCLAGISWFGFKFWRDVNAPEFNLDMQLLSPDGKFMDSTLSSGDQLYVQTATEFSLSPIKSQFLGQLIGHVSDELNIYLVQGNEDYAVLTGFLMPDLVFRDADAAPIDFGKLRISKIQLFDNQDNPEEGKSSSDPNILSEVVERLDQTAGPLPVYCKDFGMIRLYSDQLPGLYIKINIYIEEWPDKEFYFSFPADPYQGIAVGPLFERWIEENKWENLNENK